MTEFELDETTRMDGDIGRAVRLLSVRLVAVDGPSRGTSVIVSHVARVGSAEGNHLRLADPTVSRVHCELTVGTAAVTLRDAGSTNGTFAGGLSIAEAAVPLGTVVRIGHSAFRIEECDEPTYVALSAATSFGDLVGSSLEMRAVYAVLERVASSDSTLLIQGETGTGKDVAARAVHEASPRARGPFVPIDCGAIPEHLFESELFGHVRGAFTGAVSNRKGVFEEASGGTIFLDEIGEMPLSLQAKLLRAIESRTIRRVGASTAQPVDVRIVAATNRSLASCVNQGTFREDLYYRLAVVEVTLPPLRARKGDIALLATRFYQRLAGTADVLDAAFAQKLEGRAFPGNVRELKNVIERAVALGQVRPGQAATPAGPAPVLPPGIESLVPVHLPLKEARDAWTAEFESIYVRAMLKKTQGNMTRAAELAGVSRRFLQRTLVRLGLSREDAGEEDE
jgi:transcriptional regulator with PAS, ATPase and Fis domain